MLRENIVLYEIAEGVRMRAECTWYRSIYCSLCYSAVSPQAAMRKRLLMKQRPLFSSILYAAEGFIWILKGQNTQHQE